MKSDLLFDAGKLACAYRPAKPGFEFFRSDRLNSIPAKRQVHFIGDAQNFANRGRDTATSFRVLHECDDANESFKRFGVRAESEVRT